VSDRFQTIAGHPVEWKPADPSNFDRGGKPRNLLIVHCIAPSNRATPLANHARSAVGRFQSAGSGGSVQVVADPFSGKYYQCVYNDDTAYGCGNFQHNQRAIQIELPGWPDVDYDHSVVDYAGRFIGEAARAYGIPLRYLSRGELVANPNASGVTGHDQIPDPNNPALGGGRDHHTDPGPAFPWALCMSIAAQESGLPVIVGGPGGGGTAANPFRFGATGFGVRGGFSVVYWQSGGIARWGYPVSWEFVETNEHGMNYTVQYFERGRMELQPDGRVTFGRVGAELLAAKLVKMPPGFGMPYPQPWAFNPEVVPEGYPKQKDSAV
jgi:hypothetical protein